MRIRLLRAVLYIAFCAWVILAYVGWNLITDPGQTHYPQLKGWAALAVCALTALPTIDRWAKYIYVLFGGLSLGLLFAVTTGKVTGTGPPVTRAELAGLLILSLTCGFTSHSLGGRRLSNGGRVALVGLLAAFPVGIFYGSVKAFSGCLALCLACIVVARATSAADGPLHGGTRTRMGHGRRPAANVGLDREP